MQIISNPTNLRHVLLCSFLGECPIQIENINLRASQSGLKACESTFLRMIQAISNGTKCIVTKGGTHMRFYPGIVTNNQGIQLQFECGTQRNITYYLEYLILFAMFGKTTLHARLSGITNDSYDNSIDSIQYCLIPLLKEHYFFDNELVLKVHKRGYVPDGGGQIEVMIPPIRKLRNCNLQDKGYVKRIRGFASGCRIAKSILNQMGDITKKRLLEYIPDVWVFIDHYQGDKAGQSAGYSLTLKAETTTGGIITYDGAYEPQRNQTVDELVEKIVNGFLDEIENSGYISTNYQWFILTLMAISQRKTSSIKLGRISPFCIECLRILRHFFGVAFEIEQSQSQNMAIFRVLGIGMQNYARIVK